MTLGHTRADRAHHRSVLLSGAHPIRARLITQSGSDSSVGTESPSTKRCRQGLSIAVVVHHCWLLLFSPREGRNKSASSPRARVKAFVRRSVGGGLVGLAPCLSIMPTDKVLAGHRIDHTQGRVGEVLLLSSEAACSSSRRWTSNGRGEVSQDFCRYG